MLVQFVCSSLLRISGERLEVLVGSGVSVRVSLNTAGIAYYFVLLWYKTSAGLARNDIPCATVLEPRFRLGHLVANPAQPPPRCKIEIMSDVDTNLEEPEEYRGPLPPASFTLLVLSLRAQCEMQLGMVHFGEDARAAPDLEIARHTIDLMVILLAKTKGNLTLEEQRLLENSVTELRFRFVQVSDDVSKAASQKA